ncbi:MAG: reverse transcriptase domain-containing protein, partial [Gloeomargaritales cyanobacterium]
VYTALFLSRPDDTSNDTSSVNISLFSELLSEMLQNQLPDEAREFFNSSRLIALHKDPTNNLKLRPIAIGSGIRRLLCGHISRVFRPYFSKFLAPYQWGMGIPNGMDFVYLTTSALVDKYISRSETTMQNDSPTRALVQLDLKNMFNSVSRVKARQLIGQHFRHLLPLFDLMYKLPPKVWYQLPEGTWDHFLQIEGFPQGCPLSPFFSALVLHCILEELDRELRQRASERLTSKDLGDDGLGGVTDIFAFLDDTSSVVPYDDLLYMFQRFVELGTSLGCHLAPGKCTILTSTCSISPAAYLSERHRTELHTVLTTYCGGPSGELVKGTRLLGYPLGNTEFGSAFHYRAVNNLKKMDGNAQPSYFRSSNSISVI